MKLIKDGSLRAEKFGRNGTALPRTGTRGPAGDYGIVVHL